MKRRLLLIKIVESSTGIKMSKHIMHLALRAKCAWPAKQTSTHWVCGDKVNQGSR